MIYWSIAFPVVVLLVWFVWNLIKAPHQIHEEDLAAQSSREGQTPLRNSVSKSIAALIFIAVIVAAFMGLLAAKNYQIEQLRKKLNPPKQASIAPKPLPDKIIPQLVISNAPSTGLATQITNTESAIQFETSNPTAERADPEVELGKLKAKKLAQRAAQDEAARKQTQSNSDNRWTNMLPTFNYCIETFYNILKKEADRRNEGIAKTVNYFKCLPSTINFDLGETNVAEIRFQNHTNVNFSLAITKSFNYLQRTLRISCSCGYFEIQHHPAAFSKECLVSVHIPDLNEDKYVSLDQAYDLIEEDLRLLMDGQIAYSAQTNHGQ